MIKQVNNYLMLVLLTCVCLYIVTVCGDPAAGPEVAVADAERGGPVALLGTGASFPAPLYEKWFHEYNKLHPDVEINYQALGSGAGIRQFQAGLVTFGASDAAMTDEEISVVKAGVVMLPMTAGTVVLAYNLPDGPSELKLSREAYAGIFLGKVTYWDDPAVVRANPTAKLPHTRIKLITKSDASGTTFVFTLHLSAVSNEWRDGPGTGKSVNFPVGVAARGTSAVTALIKRTPGAIGYVEYGYAKQTGLSMAELENKSGNFVRADVTTGQRALASIQLPPTLRAWLPDPPGADSYPIVSYTWLLCYRKYQDRNLVRALKSVIRYCLTEGQKYSVGLGYIPLPPDVVDAATKALDEIS